MGLVQMRKESPVGTLFLMIQSRVVFRRYLVSRTNLVAAERLRRYRGHSRRGRRVRHHYVAWQAPAYSLLQGYPNKPAGETRVRLPELDLLRRYVSDRHDGAG